MTTSFNSWYADRIELTFGVFEGVKGKVWVDDVKVEEVGLMNVIRRDGAPLTVRDEKTGTVYKEGRGFRAGQRSESRLPMDTPHADDSTTARRTHP